MRKHMIAVIIILLDDLIERSPEKDRLKLGIIRYVLSELQTD